MSVPLLQLRNVEAHFPVHGGSLFHRTSDTIKAVDGVSLEIRAGEVLGLVGESGSGKSTLARTIVGLVPATAGSILFEGRDLGTLSTADRRSTRRKLQLVFQDPYASLNPRMTVFDALAEPLLAHRVVAHNAVGGRVARLMDWVGLSARHVRKYPHEFSGGQRQRIAIARALALEPKLLIADEPVSALDVSVQAQILNLLRQIREEAGLALLLISHDLSIVWHLADRIAVMYLGKVVEIGGAEQVFGSPAHPYTQAMVSAVPLVDPERPPVPILLRGEPPSPLNAPSGCPFHPRCPHADSACANTVPTPVALGKGHYAACLRLSDMNLEKAVGIQESEVRIRTGYGNTREVHRMGEGLDLQIFSARTRD